MGWLSVAEQNKAFRREGCNCFSKSFGSWNSRFTGAAKAIQEVQYQDLFPNYQDDDNFFGMASSASPGSGIPLHEYRRDVPPGWGPNIPDYPLKTYFDRLKMWYRLYDGPDETVGPLVAGRLVGRAQKLALQLRLPRPDGQVDVGSDALVRLSVEEVRDPSNPSVILQQSIISGIQALCNKLRETFGNTEQELASRSLEAFFEIRRGKMTLQEYAVEFDSRLEEANDKAGLEMNAVALFYLFFKNSGLPAKLIEDIKLQCHGDLRRYQDARNLALRLNNRSESGEGYYQDDGSPSSAARRSQEFTEDGWWTSDVWSAAGDFYQGDEFEDAWSSWYGDEEYYDAYDEREDSWHEDDWLGPEDEPLPVGEDDDQGSYPVKGGKKGNAMGVGCSVCGSKWHHASACPVNTSKGRPGAWGSDRPKGKGYGGGKPSYKGRPKGYSGSKGGGKRYGFRDFQDYVKGKKAGKGRGKGRRYYSEYPEENYFQQQKTLVSHFGTDFFSPGIQRTPPRPQQFDLTQNDELTEEFFTKKKVQFDETAEEQQLSPDEGTDAPKTEPVVKNLHFPVSLYAERECFHMIGGEKRRGLLVDPGASNGLIGSETLRDMMEHCLEGPGHEAVKWTSKTTSVSGISGGKDTTLGEITLPVCFGPGKGTYTADVLGGEGSLCPALLSNPALRQMSSVIFTNFFENGDGLMACHTDGVKVKGAPRNWITFRLLLTDSGHYLLAVDKDAQSPSKEADRKAVSFLQSAVSSAGEKWHDVRHCFFGMNGARETEHERSEAYASNHQVHRDRSEPSNHRVPRDPPEPLGHCVPREQCKSPGVPETKISDPGEDCRDPLRPVKGIYLLAKDDPLRQDSPTDEWTLFGDELTRHHKVPRRTLFTPACVQDCPVSPELLSDKRVCVVHRAGTKKVWRDNWRSVQHPHKDIDELWTGETKFWLKKDENKDNDGEATDDASRSFMEKDFDVYTGDVFPEHWNDGEKKRYSKRYAAMKEEYYTKTGRKPITPGNFKKWFARSKGQGLRWHFQELCSGSGRLSWVAVLSGLLVGFPVDYRYGWDMSLPEHQQMIGQARAEFLPMYLHASPTCAPWSVSSASKDPQARKLERQQEEPALQFIREQCERQVMADLGFGVEQPISTAMFKDKDSPLRDLERAVGVRKRQQVDQCAHGCCDENGIPVKKSTVIVGTVKMNNTAKRCNGHKGQAHAVLQGQYKGVDRTSRAAVFPMRMCRAIVDDVWRFVRAAGCQFRQWPASLVLTSLTFYECERCQFGRGALPWMEHTLIPGQCRYGRRPPGERREPLVQQDPLSKFKKQAREKDMSDVALALPVDITLDVPATLYLKFSLFRLVQDCLALFSEAMDRGVDYIHWVTDPILKAMFKNIFRNEMRLAALACSLRPWHMLTPEARITMKAAPLRLQIWGNVKDWKVFELEDLREMSHSQQRQPIDEADWVITLFGAAKDEPEPSSSSAAAGPEQVAPATPSKAGHRPGAPPPDRDLPAPASKDRVPEDSEEIEVEDETFESSPERPITPLYSFRKVFQRLLRTAESEPTTAKRLLLGLHERFYHAPVGDLRNLLARCGMPAAVLNLTSEAVKHCSVCRKFVRLPNRPQVKIGNATTFNERVQMDFFQYAGQWVCLLVDEATRYKIAYKIADRSWKEISRMLLTTWMMYFGPPAKLIADQESSVMSHEASADMERFSIIRCPKGTTSGAAGKQHTGLVWWSAMWLSRRSP